MLCLCAVAAALALPAVAAANTTTVVHLFFDHIRVTQTSPTTCVETAVVSAGTNASHGPVIGALYLRCFVLTVDSARCSGSIVVYDANGQPDHSVVIKDQVLNEDATVVPLTYGTGIWAFDEPSYSTIHAVSPTASNVELILNNN